MPDFGSALWNKPASVGVGGGGSEEGSGGASDPVTRSLRLAGSHYLTKTFSSSGNRKTYTIAFWVKRSKISTSSTQVLFSAAPSGHTSNANINQISFRPNDTLEFYQYPESQESRLATAAVFRDTSAWMHCCFSVDTTQATEADRVKIFVNGVLQSVATYTDYPSQNHDSLFNKSEQHKIGEEAIRNRYNSDVLISDFYFIDGTALSTPVGNLIEDTGYSSYKPKAFDMSSYSGNSFHIDAQPAHDADLLVSSVGRNDGDTLFADMAAGHTITRYGNTHHDNTVGNPFGSGTAMYFDGSGDYLQTSTSSDLTFGTGDFTVETWFYPTTVDTSTGYKGIISDELYSSTGGWAVSQRDDELSLWIKNTSGSWVSFVADGALTANQWQHIAVSYDSSSTTTRLFVDGTVVASGTTSGWNLTGDQIEIGRSVSGQEITGYLFDARATKGTARYTSNFTAPSAPFELNPVYLGGDQSGNKNHFTPTGISAAHDVMLDTPTKNYATLNPLSKSSGGSLAEGNLKVPFGGTYPSNVLGSIGVSSGKWYWEVYLEGGSYANGHACGVAVPEWANKNTDPYGSSTPYNHYVDSRQYFYNSGTGTSNSTSFTAADIIGVALNVDDDEVSFYKNGTIIGSAQSLEANQTWMPFHKNSSYTSLTQWVNYGQDPTFAGNKTSGQDTSQSEFYYAPPTGFKSLNTSNLDDPSVTPAEHFDTLTYAGSGSSRSITGLDFQPDLVWLKDRTTGGSNGFHCIHDSVRGDDGTHKYILSSDNTITTDTTYSGYGVTSFNSDGFSIINGGSLTNDSSRNYVAWNWKESASAGFDIVTYEGDSDSEGDTQDISHSLGVAPDMIIVKARDGRAYNDYYAEDAWYVWHKDLTDGSSIFLNSNSAEVDYSSYGTEPISSVGSSTFTVCNSFDSNNYLNDFLNWGDPYEYYTGDNERYVAYLFSGVEGFSKFGKYTGGSDPFIYTGFKVGFWMVKRIDSSGHWTMFDSARDAHNLVDHQIEPNYANAESPNSTKGGDFLSNGFKVRSSQSEVDASGGTYIYAAFAESPFKHANAR